MSNLLSKEPPRSTAAGRFLYAEGAGGKEKQDFFLRRDIPRYIIDTEI